MPAKIYHVRLSDEERADLTGLVNKGKGVARRITRSRILLLADENRSDDGWKDVDIAKALGISQRTVERTREKCVMQGIESALNHTRPKQTKAPILDGEAEAKLVQLACSSPPDGYERWSLRLLTAKFIELEVVESVSRETIRSTLKKMNLSLG
jgi:hypothetical protein